MAHSKEDLKKYEAMPKKELIEQIDYWIGQYYQESSAHAKAWGQLSILREKALAEKAKAANVDVTLEKYEGAIHLWHWFGPNIPESVRSVAQIGEFILNKTA